MSPRTPLILPAVLLALGLGLAPAPTIVRAQVEIFPTAPGSLDPNFNLNGGSETANLSFLPAQYNFTPFSLAVQPQNKGEANELIIGGDNATLFRVFLQPTQRIFTDVITGLPNVINYAPGEIDNGFFTSPNIVNGFGNEGRITYALAVLSDGRVLVGGRFGESLNETSVLQGRELNFIRLLADGRTEVDAAGTGLSVFNVNLGSGADDSVLAILPRFVLSPGATEPSILLGGQFSRFNRQTRGRVVQLNPDGTSDATFNNNLGSGASGIVFNLAEAVGLTFDPVTGAGSFGFNGQVYVCGDYDRFNGKSPGKLVRLNPDGTLDPSFAPRIVGRSIAVAVQPADGKVLVGGDLDSINGTAVNNLARLNLDGSLDPTFQAFISVSFPEEIPPTSVYVIKLQSDGKLLIGGNYQAANDVTRRYLSRLLPDGTLDATFDANESTVPDDNIPRSPNAVQAIVSDLIPATSGTGFFPGVVVAQTRGNKKIVPGDDGRYRLPVKRVFTESLTAPAGAATTISPVTITSIVSTATETSLPDANVRGIIRIQRSGPVTTPLTVRLKFPAGSTASYGADYTLFFSAPDISFASIPAPSLPTTVTIPAGASSVEFAVQANVDGLGENNEAVKIKLVTDPSAYVIQGNAKATVTIPANGS